MMAGALPFPAPQVLLGRPDGDRRHIFESIACDEHYHRTHLGDDPHPPGTPASLGCRSPQAEASTSVRPRVSDCPGFVFPVLDCRSDLRARFENRLLWIPFCRQL
jgi:hypothetical protein